VVSLVGGKNGILQKVYFCAYTLYKKNRIYARNLFSYLQK
jgi:hypothetical protein